MNKENRKNEIKKLVQKFDVRIYMTQELQEIVSDLTYPPCGFNKYDNNTNGYNSNSNCNDNNNNDDDNSNGNTDNKHKNINNANKHFWNS